MKIIITEKQLSRLVNEQIPLSNLIGNASDFGISTPDFVGISDPGSLGNCKKGKTPYELMIEIFKYARSTQGQPKHTDQKIQEKTYGLDTTSNIPNVMSKISTIQELGSVLNAYSKSHGHNLSTRIDNEMAKKIWEKISKFAKGVIKNYCKEGEKNITLPS